MQHPRFGEQRRLWASVSASFSAGTQSFCKPVGPMSSPWTRSNRRRRLARTTSPSARAAGATGLPHDAAHVDVPRLRCRTVDSWGPAALWPRLRCPAKQREPSGAHGPPSRTTSGPRRRRRDSRLRRDVAADMTDFDGDLYAWDSRAGVVGSAAMLHYWVWRVLRFEGTCCGRGSSGSRRGSARGPRGRRRTRRPTPTSPGRAPRAPARCATPCARRCPASSPRGPPRPSAAAARAPSTPRRARSRSRRPPARPSTGTATRTARRRAPRARRAAPPRRGGADAARRRGRRRTALRNLSRASSYN